MLAKLKAWAWARQPWSKRALLCIQEYAHPRARAGYIGWSSKVPPFSATWGCGSKFYRATWQQDGHYGGVELLTLETEDSNVPGGWRNIRGAFDGQKLVLPVRQPKGW